MKSKTIVLRSGTANFAIDQVVKAVEDLKSYIDTEVIRSKTAPSGVKKAGEKAKKRLDLVTKEIDTKGKKHFGENTMDTKQMLSFADALYDVLDEGKKEEKMMDFLADKLENSDMDIDELEKAFVKKFGRSAGKKYRDYLDMLM